MPRFEHQGGALATALQSGIDASAVGFNLANPANWPTGAVNDFILTVDPGKVNEETIRCDSRSGSAIVVAASGRGFDGTSPSPHDSSAVVIHSGSALEYDEANAHIYDTSRHDHSQYLRVVDHNAAAHPASVLGTASVISAKIAAAALDTISHYAAGFSPVILQAGDPGAGAGANRLWFQTTKRVLLIRNAANTAWEVISVAGPGVDYTPALFNCDEGAGINIARYTRMGRLVVVNGFFRFVDPGATTSSSAIGVGLPVVAADLSATMPEQFYFHGAARGFDLPAGGTYASVGIIRAGDPGSPDVDFNRISLFATAGTGGWNNTIPFTWNGSTNDGFSWFAQYEAADAIDTAFQ